MNSERYGLPCGIIINILLFLMDDRPVGITVISNITIIEPRLENMFTQLP